MTNNNTFSMSSIISLNLFLNIIFNYLIISNSIMIIHSVKTIKATTIFAVALNIFLLFIYHINSIRGALVLLILVSLISLDFLSSVLKTLSPKA